ncbi:hypothetical protein B0T10DRAFT_192879 [Thelonectria olida]|uniref:Uncharacterized protein n=1 Tax=Thelonectria olida TaxID=1576542 RepID=A0A9P8VWV6_9HYPO|nr:hypothetical protein B0T10DRAFT_192879 [Thelonectria olida]
MAGQCRVSTGLTVKLMPCWSQREIGRELPNNVCAQLEGSSNLAGGEYRRAGTAKDRFSGSEEAGKTDRLELICLISQWRRFSPQRVSVWQLEAGKTAGRGGTRRLGGWTACKASRSTQNTVPLVGLGRLVSLIGRITRTMELCGHGRKDMGALSHVVALNLGGPELPICKPSFPWDWEPTPPTHTPLPFPLLCRRTGGMRKKDEKFYMQEKE